MDSAEIEDSDAPQDTAPAFGFGYTSSMHPITERGKHLRGYSVSYTTDEKAALHLLAYELVERFRNDPDSFRDFSDVFSQYINSNAAAAVSTSLPTPSTSIALRNPSQKDMPVSMSKFVRHHVTPLPLAPPTGPPVASSSSQGPSGIALDKLRTLPTSDQEAAALHAALHYLYPMLPEGPDYIILSLSQCKPI